MAGVPTAVVPYDPFVFTNGPFAPLNSPVFTGDPSGPTPAQGDNDTSFATTAFVRRSIGWFNVKDYGAAGTNTGDDSTAINAAITAAAAVNGGTVYFPAGSYRILSPINLASKIGIRLVGQQSTNSGAGTAANIFYDNGNTDARVIDARTSSGIEIANLYVYSNAAFAGTLIDYSGTVGTGTSFGYIHDCGLSSTLATSLILFDYVAQMRVVGNNISGGVIGIKGPVVGHNADSVIVSGNQFTRQTTASIQDPGGQKWTITSNDFEPLNAANNPMVCITTSHAVTSLTVSNNWFGDGGTENIGMLQLIGGTNIVIKDNYVGAASAAGGGKTHCFLAFFTTAANGIEVTGNYIGGNVEKFVEFNSLAHTGVYVKHNILQTDVTTPFSNAGSITRYALIDNVMVGGARVANEKRSDLFCRVSSGTLQTIATGVTATALTFDTEQWDDDNMHVGGSGTITIPTGGDGLYDIHGSVWFVADNRGQRSLEIWKGATRYSVAWDGNPSGANQSALETHATIRLVAGDTIQLRASQTTTANLNTDVTDGRAFVWLSVARVGY